MVVSYRSDEAPVLAETLAVLARRETTRVGVAGLTARDAQRMAGAILRRDISEGAGEALCARTDPPQPVGIPLGIAEDAMRAYNPW